MTTKSNVSLVALATLGLVLPTSAFAHVGIGPTSGFAHGFMHPLSGVDHILAMVAVGMFAASLGGRALWAVPLTFMSMMVVGGALGVAAVPLPYVEFGIALSVVALGAAVAAQRQWPVTLAMAFVGAFAIVHGHAHGSEMANTMSATEYGLGFVLGTGLLHLVGIAMGLGIMMFGASRARQVLRIGGVAIAAAGVELLATLS